MKSVTLFFVLLFFGSFKLFGQTNEVKINLYFDSDKFDLRKESKKTIDKVTDTLPIPDVFKITVSGNTDNSADSLYNIKLSENRTEAIISYLASKGFNKSIINENYYGEDKPIATNSNEDGKQKNRRVDVTFYYNTDSKNLIDSIAKPIIPIDTCEGRDTIIILAQGTQVVFNRCEYLLIRECLVLTEMNSTQTALANGIALTDVNGFPLTSCGMLKVDFKQNCAKEPCFKQHITVRFPFPKNEQCNFCGSNAGLYNLMENGLWRNENGQKSEIKIIRIEDKMFYQFEMACPGYSANCDCKPPLGKNVKFKIKRKYKIDNVKVIFDCPTTIIKLKPKRRKNIVKGFVPCWYNAYVTATIINKNGDTLILERRPLNDLTKRKVFSRCEKTPRELTKKKYGNARLPKRPHYRKYIIKQKLLINKK